VTRLTQKHRSEAQSAKAEEEMRRCRAAITELKVSKSSFNVAWINATSKQAATTSINGVAVDTAPKIKFQSLIMVARLASVSELYVALISRNVTFSAILFSNEADTSQFRYFSRCV
jgi:hypothetical protein